MSTDLVNNVDNADNVRVNIGHDSVRQIPKDEYFQLCNSNIRSMLKKHISDVLSNLQRTLNRYKIF